MNPLKEQNPNQLSCKHDNVKLAVAPETRKLGLTAPKLMPIKLTWFTLYHANVYQTNVYQAQGNQANVYVARGDSDIGYQQHEKFHQAEPPSATSSSCKFKLQVCNLFFKSSNHVRNDCTSNAHFSGSFSYCWG